MQHFEYMYLMEESILCMVPSCGSTPHTYDYMIHYVPLKVNEYSTNREISCKNNVCPLFSDVQLGIDSRGFSPLLHHSPKIMIYLFTVMIH